MPARARGISGRAIYLTGLLAACLTAIAGCGEDGTGVVPAETGPVGAKRLPAAGLQQQFVRVVRTVSPQVVQIQSRLGRGSGVVFDGRGNVVTNAHVVDGARRFGVTLSGGDRHPRDAREVRPGP
jgi:S1-C subfamily serine protease